MKKKTIIIVSALLVIILAALFTLPYFFKDDIVAAIRDAANENLNARVDFTDIDLTLFRNFPNLTIGIEDLSVTGVDSFAGINLARIGRLDLAIDLIGAISGNYSVETFGLTDADLDIRVLKSGRANWDIAKTDSSAAPTPEDESATPFHLALKNYYLDNLNISYRDASLGCNAFLKQFNLDGSGDLTEDRMDMKITMDAADMTIVYGGIPYLNHVRYQYNMVMDMDMANSKYTFKDNSMSLNGLKLAFTGWLAMPGDDMDMDISYKTDQSDFKSLLSLIPAVYSRDFESVQTEGKMAFNGYAKGKYTDTGMPGFGLNILVEDAMFKYPDLPGKTDNIQLDLRIAFPGGADMDALSIDLPRFHADMAGQNLDAALSVKTPVSDPEIKCDIQSQLNLAKLATVIPMEEGESYNGSVTADIHAAGNYSDIEQGYYDRFMAKGQLILLDMDYKSADMPYTTHINKMYLNFNPESIELSTFKGQLGQSDISMSGTIDNLIAYLFTDKPLKGRFSFNSKHFDVNELMAGTGDSTETDATAGTDSLSTAPEIPANIDFRLQCAVDELIYDKLDIKKLRGAVHLHNSKVDMEDLNMALLDGNLKLSGSYDAAIPEKPVVDMDMDIRHFNVRKSYEAFNTVKKIAPLAAHCGGYFSTKQMMKLRLDEHMEPVYNSLNASGTLVTDGVNLNDAGVMQKVAAVLNLEEKQQLDINKVDIMFEIEDGKVSVKPFDFTLGNGKGKLGGNTTLDQQINYVMNLDMPTADLGNAAMGVVNNLVAQANKAGAAFSAGDRVKLDVLIGGTFLKPTVKPAFRKGEAMSVENLKDQAKDIVEDKVEEVKDQAKDQAYQEALKQLETAKSQAEKMKAEARKQAENVRQEANKAAQQVEDAASNPIAKVAARKTAKKMRSEGDAKAKDMVAKADKEADALVKKASDKVEALK